MRWPRLHWYWSARQKPSEGTGFGQALFRPVRRWLERAAPSWAASPWRRLVQTGSLLTFLGLFFYVCWPYGTRPESPWGGWVPVEVDTVTGQIRLAADEPRPEPWAQGTSLYVTDPGHPEATLLGKFRVTGSTGQELTLQPVEPLADAQLDRLTTSLGPWALSSKDPNRWPSHFADDLSAKQKIPASTFLAMDPLASIASAIAGRSWIGSLAWAAAILLICLAIPRGFCGYLCPLGALIDLFDWAVSRRIRRFHLAHDGWWRWLRYGILGAVLAASLCGVMLAGFVSAIPVLTRGMAFAMAPLQTGLLHDWRAVPPMHAGQYVSLGLFAGLLVLGLLGPRFWCRYVCPTGAIFSLWSLVRFHQRHVTDDCAGCGRCALHCPFDAVGDDFTTRTGDCAFCQTCGGVCPAGAIRFGGRWEGPARTDPAETAPAEPQPVSARRRFLTGGIGLTAGCLTGTALAAVVKAADAGRDVRPAGPVRPPGSLPEPEFLKTCVRCGECLQACPNSALQPAGWDQGLEGLWTPTLVADWAGCEPSCNRCGQVCPTGAIRALPMETKRSVRLGLAMVDQQSCLPFAQKAACRWCVEACKRAGYDAIEFIRVGTEVDEAGHPIADTGYLAPVIRADKCVGCGLCQTRCYAINVRQQGLLTRSAIRVEAGGGA